MMRIAVAGGGGLGYLLATSLSQADNAYNVVVLSRTARPEYAAFDIEVHPVDYTSYDSLSYALQGVDLVISTISGAEQVNLILAAGQGTVRLFVPSEFEGNLSHRPSPFDALDRGSAQALSLLRDLERRRRLKYTIFTCGVFMERFHPYGLAHFGIGYGSGISNAGDYIVNINNGSAEYAEFDSTGEPIRVCLTSVYDVARFVVAAVDLGPGNWPHEFTMRGDRMSLRALVGSCSLARDTAFDHQIIHAADLKVYLNYYLQSSELARAAYYQRLIATADGRYNFSRATLNDAINNSPHINVQPVTFVRWLSDIYPTSA